ncbi:MAG: hypothetical protein J6X55_15515 [Victivallales bacterium]|nr:hypothetical protein [Victivallales bacterium]
MRYLIRILVLVLLVAVSAVARPWIALFGSRDCEDCAALKSAWSKKYNSPDDPVMVFINIDVKANYRFLNAVEDDLETVAKGNTFPVILMGREMVCGREGFNSLEPRMAELVKQAPTGGIFAGIEAVAEVADAPIVEYNYSKKALAEMAKAKEKADGKAAVVSDNSSAVHAELLFFRQPGCKKCERQSREFGLLEDMVTGLNVDEFDVTTIEGQAMLSRVRKAFDIPQTDENLAPMVVWTNGYVTGRLATAKELAEALKNAKGTPFWKTPLTQEELNGEKSRLEAFIGATRWVSVLGGGLADGINPCAFATSIFLISYLLYLKRRRTQIIIVGAGFCLGVFLTYFLYGIALSMVLRQLQEIHWLKVLIYGIFALVGFVLCVLHLRDALRYRRTGKASDMDMGLSKETHRGIHEKIRKFTDVHAWLMCPAAIVLGGIVSSMELACTGQVYFPVLMALSSLGINGKFLLFLFLYNICFIVPLVVITALAAYGVGAKALGDWAKHHVFATKVIMAALFAVLGGLMIALALAAL